MKPSLDGQRPRRMTHQGLDKTRLAELRSAFPHEEMPDFLRSVAAEIAIEFDRITTAVSEGNRVTIAASAHRLKNSAGMIGATGLADAAAELESQARGDRPGAQPCDQTAVRALSEQWNGARAGIAAELAQAD
jgi:HPt (histidine-containing phosphotransfer) domain-containing protein